MTGMTRHVGRIVNTGTPCVVVFMQLPERPDHALVVPTKSLPDRVEQALMQVLQSPEGQANPVLANVLNARLMPDMSNRSILGYLHETRRLVPVHVDNMVMTPLPSTAYPLRRILEDMGKSCAPLFPAVPPVAAAPEAQLTSQSLAEAYAGHQAPQNPYGAQANPYAAQANPYGAPQAQPVNHYTHPVQTGQVNHYAQAPQVDPYGQSGVAPSNLYQDPYGAPQAPQAPHAEINKYNPYGQTQQIETHSRNNGIALNLLAEARDFEAVARKKREEAYRYDPTLRPQEPQVVLPLAQADFDADEAVSIAITTDIEAEAPVKRPRRAPKTES
jgi:hypothetical protein